jgi:hypothetical protein
MKPDSKKKNVTPVKPIERKVTIGADRWCCAAGRLAK